MEKYCEISSWQPSRLFRTCVDPLLTIVTREFISVVGFSLAN
jgi:hypothetical protein